MTVVMTELGLARQRVREALQRIDALVDGMSHVEQIAEVSSALEPTVKLVQQLARTENTATEETMGTEEEMMDVEEPANVTAAQTDSEAKEAESIDVPEQVPNTSREEREEGVRQDGASSSDGSDDEDANAMPAVEKIEGEVKRIRQELLELDVLVIEYSKVERVDEKEASKAAYRSKAASNDLMNRMLELDGLVHLSKETRRRRKAVVREINALLDHAEATHEKLAAMPTTSPRAVEAAQNQAELEEAQRERHEWVSAMKGLILKHCTLQARVQRDELDEHYALSVRTAGAIRGDDVELQVHGRQLKLSLARVPTEAELLAMHGAAEGRTADEQAAHLLHKLDGAFGAYAARFDLPSDACPTQIQQQARNGVLTIVIPKQPQLRRAYTPRGFPHTAQRHCNRPQSARSSFPAHYGYDHQYDHPFTSAFRGFW